MKGRSQHSRHTTPTLESSSSRTSSRIVHARVSTCDENPRKRKKKNYSPCVFRAVKRVGAACGGGVIVVIIVIGVIVVVAQVRTRRRRWVNDPGSELTKVLVHEYWDDVRFGSRGSFTISSIHVV